MKKLLTVFLFCALFLTLPLHADDEDFNLLDDEALWNDIEAFRESTRQNADNSARQSETPLVQDRAFEVGLANLTVGFPKNLLKKVYVIDLEELGKGFFVNLSLVPFYFKYNHNDDWGAGVFTGADVIGDLMLSQKMLGFQKAKNEKSDFAAAVFAEAGLGGFFHIGNFKVKASVAGFVPLLYVYPREINYTLDDKLFELDYDIRLYSAMKDGKFSLDKKLGIDLRLGAEYPLASFLDLGVDITNIPILPATLTDYQLITGHIYFPGDTSGDLDSLLDIEGSLPWKKFDKRIWRPFKTLFWAGWRPLDIKLFSLIGSAGFQINLMYDNPFSMEGGLKARLNWENIIIFTAGARYEDRLWKNGVDLALNCRAFELDLGIDMRSHDIGESWKGSFIGLSFGIKAGW
jgi:hypothetical protein